MTPAPGPRPPSDTEPGPGADRQARAYETRKNQLFLAQCILTGVLLVCYFFSGASAHLAEGLRSRFDHPAAWPLVNGMHILISMLGYAALLFPFRLYGDHGLEHQYGLSHQSLNSWLVDYFMSLLLELGLALVFFELVYALLRWSPGYWWLWAAGGYILLGIVLATVAPVWIMPLFHKFEPLADPALTAAVAGFAEKAGLRVVGVYRWGLEEKTSTANAALTGLGRTRRIILGDTMLRGYTQDEIVAVLAHEVGHYRHHDMTRLMAVSTLLALAGFYLAARFLAWAVQRPGCSFANTADIGAFPLLLVALFLFMLCTMPLSNGYARRLEFAADAFAVRAMGSADPLVGALDKLAAQNLADRQPPAWIEFLLHSHPALDRRIRRARELAATIPAAERPA